MFSSMKKIAIAGTKSVSFRASAKARVNNPFSRCMVTLQQKEQGEEAKYFRQQDEIAKAEIRAKLEKILAMDDKDSKKQEIVEILEGKPADKGFLAKLGLNEVATAAPVGFVLALPLIQHEFLELNAETYLMAAFWVTFGTLYTQLRGPIMEESQQNAKNLLDQFNKLDDDIRSGLIASQKSNESSLELDKDVASIHQLIDDLAVLQAEALNAKEKHKFRDAIERKLESIASLESAATYSMTDRMTKQIKADVVAKFTTDKKAKERALEQAIAVLTSGNGAKLGKDVVGEEFISALKQYREDYSKKSASADPILIKLQKDVDAVVNAPISLSKGGNVYEISPIV